MFFEFFTLLPVAFFVMVAGLLFYFASSLILMLVSFVATRKLCVNTWMSVPGKWIAITIAQVMVYFAIKYNYAGQVTSIAPMDITTVICSFAFGLIWACYLYTTHFNLKTKK